MDSVRDGYRLTTDKAAIDVDAVHAFLGNESYWARGIPRDVVARAIDGSLCFSIFAGDRQVGFARVVSDHATVAYLSDVYILPLHRGEGLSKWLVDCILSHPALQGLRRFVLVTSDAHGLYEKFGFHALKSPERWMEKHDPDVYARPTKSV
jgi:GNAT superfamily N-acetyltransferase